MSKQQDLKVDAVKVLTGRLQAQNRIILALFSFVMVYDKAGAKDIVQRLRAGIINSDKLIDDPEVCLGFTIELSDFVDEVKPYLNSRRG